jgi:hypothetical protein
MLSYNAPTHNLVLKVTVPKRTGRKRKKGSDEPFREAGDNPTDGPRVLRRKLADNADEYSVKIVGMIQNTHRYRGKPVFLRNCREDVWADKSTQVSRTSSILLEVQNL